MVTSVRKITKMSNVEIRIRPIVVHLALIETTVYEKRRHVCSPCRDESCLLHQDGRSVFLVSSTFDLEFCERLVDTL